jgi:streptogramin lyase
MSPGGSRGKGIYSRPAKCGNLVVALAFTAGTLLIGAQPGYADKAHRPTAVGDISEYTIPTTTQGDPAYIAPGPDGNLWFTDTFNSQVVKVTTSGAATAYRVPGGCCGLLGIVAGPDGNLWLANASVNNVDKVTTSGALTEYPIPTAGSVPYGIAVGPDGNLWFTEYSGNKVAKVTTSGLFTEFAIPTANSGPLGIAAGPDGNLWFTEEFANQVAKVTTAGAVTEYPVPTANSQPFGIAAGPDGNLWFTEQDGNKVAKVISGAAAPSTWVAGVAGTDGGLWTLANGASGFTSDGGGLLGAPAVVSIPQTLGPRLPLYIATGTDHDLYVRGDTKGWQHLTTSPAFCIDNPAGVVIGSTLYVACQGSDHALWHAETAAPSGTNLPTISSAWQSLGGVLTAGPAVAAVGGTPTYVVVGTGNQIYQRTLSTGYSAIANWRCNGHPAVAASGTTTYFACHGTDSALWYATNPGSGWGPAQSLSGVLIDGPGIAATSSGPIFFAEGTDNALYHRGLTGGWTRDGGKLQYGAAAAGN